MSGHPFGDLIDLHVAGHSVESLDTLVVRLRHWLAGRFPRILKWCFAKEPVSPSFQMD